MGFVIEYMIIHALSFVTDSTLSPIFVHFLMLGTVSFKKIFFGWVGGWGWLYVCVCMFLVDMIVEISANLAMPVLFHEMELSVSEFIV